MEEGGRRREGTGEGGGERGGARWRRGGEGEGGGGVKGKKGKSANSERGYLMSLSIHESFYLVPH